MNLPADPLWSVRFEGLVEQVVLVEDVVVVLFRDSSEKGFQAVGVDEKGEVLWTRDSRSQSLRRVRGSVLFLDETGLIALGPDGKARGHVARPSDGVPPTQLPMVVDRTESLVIVWNRYVYFSSPELDVVERILLPKDCNPIGMIDETFFWNDEDSVWSCESGGDPRHVVTMEPAWVEEAMTTFELETGSPAYSVLRLGPEDKSFESIPGYIPPGEHGIAGIPSLIGERIDYPFGWVLKVDARNRRLFMVNYTVPHVVVCLGPDGSFEWAREFSSACCGRCPVALQEGNYVLETNCGCLLSWFAPNGRILARVEHGLDMARSGTIRGAWTWTVGADQSGLRALLFDQVGNELWSGSFEKIDRVGLGEGVELDVDIEGRRLFIAVERGGFVTLQCLRFEDLGIETLV